MPTNIFSDEWGIFYMVDATSQIETIFNPDIVHKAFETKISHRASRGIDGTTLKNFVIDREAVLIGTKCIDGSFKFTPYLQRLKLKGKGKPPRGKLGKLGKLGETRDIHDKFCQGGNGDFP